MTASSSFDREQLRALGRWAERLADPGFELGSWVPSWTDDDGVIQLAWFEPGPGLLAFIEDAGRHGWIRVFDWMAWLKTPEGQRLASEPGAVDRASADDLARLLTAIIRSDRFSEGSIAGAYESGLLVAVARRAAALAGAAG